MDENEELIANLETTRSEATTAQKLAEQGAYLLRKVEEEKKTFQTKTCRLVEEKATTVAEKEKTEEETARLRQKLQDLWAGFATQKEDLEVNYQKQVDDMFFYGYQCCMKKHGIANDTPNLSSNDENDEFLGGFTQ